MPINILEIVGFGFLFCMCIIWSMQALSSRSYVSALYSFLSMGFWFAFAQINLYVMAGTVFTWISFFNYAIGVMFLIIGIATVISSFNATKQTREWEL